MYDLPLLHGLDLQVRSIPDLYDTSSSFIMLPGGSHTICMILDRFPGLDLYYTVPARHVVLRPVIKIQMVDDV